MYIMYVGKIGIWERYGNCCSIWNLYSELENVGGEIGCYCYILRSVKIGLGILGYFGKREF